MIEQDLFTALKTITEVSNRVYAVTAPQDTKAPYIRYQLPYDGVVQGIAGCVTGRTTRVQVDIFATTYEEAKSLKEQAESLIIGLKGGEISSQDLYDDETKLHRQLIEFKKKD